jgi:hypothetical protein
MFSHSLSGGVQDSILHRIRREQDVCARRRATEQSKQLTGVALWVGANVSSVVIVRQFPDQPVDDRSQRHLGGGLVLGECQRRLVLCARVPSEGGAFVPDRSERESLQFMLARMAKFLPFRQTGRHTNSAASSRSWRSGLLIKRGRQSFRRS